MRKKLLFGVHNHQPVGNFRHVFDHSFERSYKPFLEIMYEYPQFKFSMHTTGPLWEYFEGEHPEYVEMVREMVLRGQLELVISGFYEPVLASIPHRDRIGQINLAKGYIKDRFNYDAKGLWLTERVWESEIVQSLVECGIKYVLVDDFHFLSAGKKKEELHGYYVTEGEGRTLAIFPIDETLRYLIPFREVHQSIDYIKNIPGSMAIIFDDGEKFGLWPGTFEWVYEKGWLRNFVEAVLNSGDIEPVTYSEALKTLPPLGRIYLPTASYFEMGEWSLPADGAVDFIKFVNKLRAEGVFDHYRRFVRGGIWRNFLVKYEESNNMHKKMLYLSDLLSAGKSRKLKFNLYKAQCNDAYWHGVFGGLYLPHLRKEIYSNLIEIDRKVKSPGRVVDDLNKDGRPEISVKNKELRISVIPHLGGSIYEISSFKYLYNFQDTLTRRFEHYHEGVKIGEPPKEGVASIHEQEKWIDEQSAKEMVYDSYPRYSFFLHFLPEALDFQSLRYSRYQELGDFATGEFDYRLNGNSIRLTRQGRVKGEREVNVIAVKYIKPVKGGVDLALAIKGEEELNHTVAIELNLKFEVPMLLLEDRGEKISHSDYVLKGRNYIEIADEILKVILSIESSKCDDIYLYPILTISQSEKGFDLVYQGTSIFLFAKLKGKNYRDTIRIRFKGGRNA
ncbi:MAG: DUF1926 domain-containing protein [bacterium]|nr:DUF1926 domain-containing protein [bacterium]